ncbi:unnamed protein product [Amaranthus hypochondriacus]
MTSAKTNLVMTVIGFVVSMVFIVFICTKLIRARIRLRASRRIMRRHIAAASAATFNLNSLEAGMNGVDPPILANFPTKKYGDDYFSSANSGQCSICLAEYHKEDVLRILPYCGHYFHIKCIDIWLLQHCTCPVCRISLRVTNEKKQSMQLMSSSRSYHNSNIPAVSPHHHFRFLSRTSETGGEDAVQENQHLEADINNMELPEENVILKTPQVSL